MDLLYAFKKCNISKLGFDKEKTLNWKGNGKSPTTTLQHFIPIERQILKNT